MYKLQNTIYNLAEVLHKELTSLNFTLFEYSREAIRLEIDSIIIQVKISDLDEFELVDLNFMMGQSLIKFNKIEQYKICNYIRSMF